MSVIEGVGDEVTIFFTFFFVFIGLLTVWLFVLVAAFSTTASRETRPGADQTTTRPEPDSDPAAAAGGNLDPTADLTSPAVESVKSASDNSMQNSSQEGLKGNRDDGDGDGNGADGSLKSSESRNSCHQRRLYPDLHRPTVSGNVSAFPTPEGTAASADPVEELAHETERLDGHIRVKLKYLDDRVRHVQVKPDEQIGEFKRIHFASELAENLIVRLIYNGQELRQDASSLSSYHIDDLSIIHCLVTRSARPPASGPGSGALGEERDMSDLDLGHFMYPLFGLILALIWYCRVVYRNFFNAMSTLALIGISVLFLFTLIITYRTAAQPAQQTGRQATVQQAATRQPQTSTGNHRHQHTE